MGLILFGAQRRERSSLTTSPSTMPGTEPRPTRCDLCQGFPLAHPRSRGLGERGGVDDVAVALTPAHHDDHKFASIRTSRDISPYFLGVAMPYASKGFACSKGSMTVPSQSSRSPARVARSWRAARI